MAKKDKEKVKKIQFFSEDTNTFYQLYFAKEGEAPVLKINGVPMHRFIKMSPTEDAKIKVKSFNPKGNVLEICTGLGYSAIEMAHLPQVSHVTTIEYDFEVIHMAKQNPFSAELFNNKKIKLIE
jgi:predicted methyltransferase